MDEFYGEAQIPAMLAEFGEDVTMGSTTVKALIDRPSETVLGGRWAALDVAKWVFAILTGSLPGLAVGSTITWRGVDYLAAETRQVHRDGALTQIAVALKDA